MNELKTWENLNEAFRTYREDIYTFIYYKANKSKDFAEDITQDTFEKAWIKRDLYKGGNLKNWLFQIAINIAKDQFRKNNKFLELNEINETFVESSETETYKYYIIVALKQLTEKEKELIILFYILDYSHKEIAEILNSREGAIRVAVHRSFLKLKKIANENIT